MNANQFYCPRRLESLSTPVVHPDEWREGPQAFRTCSWCGSLHPDDAITLLHGGALATPTDKDYKLYIRTPGGHECKAYFQHFEAQHKDSLIQLNNERRINFGAPGCFYVLPFFTRVKPPAPVVVPDDGA